MIDLKVDLVYILNIFSDENWDYFMHNDSNWWVDIDGKLLLRPVFLFQGFFSLRQLRDVWKCFWGRKMS